MEEIRIEGSIKKEIDALLAMSAGYVGGDFAAHEMEKGLLKQLLRLGFALLCHILAKKVEEHRWVRAVGANGAPLERKGDVCRQYLSLFGMIGLQRPSYWGESTGKVSYVDQALKLPLETNWSYNLQELVGGNASENDHGESVRVINKVLGLNLSGKSSERNVGHLGGWVEAYYGGAECAGGPRGSCYSLSLDGKGVPKIKKKKAAGTEAQAKKRRAKGEKPNIMQMATVAVGSCFIPKERSAENILKGLMDSPLSKIKPNGADKPPDRENDNRWHRDIHRRAFVGDQLKAVDYGVRHIGKCVEKTGGRFVVPIDAGIGLEEKVLACVEKYGLQSNFDGIILDVIHVSEYVWDAATAILGEASKLRHEWVRQVMLDLLDSKTTKVIEDLKQIVEKSALSQSRSKQVGKAITYFTNHQHKMDYKTFIQKGCPVSSALVEAACGHLVKDRMEQSGMRWSTAGAQNVLDIRAVKQNGNMEHFMDFVIEQEHAGVFKTAA